MPRFPKPRALAALAAAISSLMWGGATAHADKFWFSDSDGNFNNAANWDADGAAPLTGSSVPTAERAVFQLGTQRNVTINASTSLTAVQTDTTSTSNGGWNITAAEGVSVTVTGASTAVNNNATALRAYAGTIGSQTVTFDFNIVLGAAAGATQTAASQNTGNAPLFHISGDISELNAGVKLSVAGGGSNNNNVILLSGTNSFTGDFIASSRAAVTTIGDKGEASAAGAGNRIVMGFVGNAPSLEYRGGTQDTNRDLHLSNVASTKTISNAGTGHLTFSGAITGDEVAQDLILKSTDVSGTGVLEFGGGFANYGATFTRITVRNNAGTVILGGNNTFGNNVVGGDLVVGINATNAGGTVLVNGTTGATADVVVAIGTLGGTGTINGATKIGNGTGGRDSIVAPGSNGIGHLTLASAAMNNGDAQLNIELNDAGAGASDGTVDLLTVTGALNLTGAALNFAATGTLNDAAYVFATYGSLTGTFTTTLNLPDGYAVDYHYLDTNTIALVTVPEPASMGLLALTALGLLRRRKVG